MRLFIGRLMIAFYLYLGKVIIIAFGSMITLFYAHKHPLLTIKNRPPEPLNTSNKVRLHQGYRAAFLVSILTPLNYYLSMNNTDFMACQVFFVSCSFIFGLLLPLNRQAPNAPDLILNKHMLGQHFQVHLKEHDAPLTRHVYKQLNILLHELQQQGAETLTMTSPLFYHPSGTLRSLSRLKTLASDLGVTMTHRRIVWYGSILNKASLFMTRHTTKRNAASLQQLGPHWHTITFHFKGKTPSTH